MDVSYSRNVQLWSDRVDKNTTIERVQSSPLNDSASCGFVGIESPRVVRAMLRHARSTRNTGQRLDQERSETVGHDAWTLQLSCFMSGWTENGRVRPIRNEPGPNMRGHPVGALVLPLLFTGPGRTYKSLLKRGSPQRWPLKSTGQAFSAPRTSAIKQSTTIRAESRLNT